jgi:hypothetical protein
MAGVSCPCWQGGDAGVAEHVGMHFQFDAGGRGTRSTMRAKPALVNGDPRSLTKTKHEDSVSL